MAITKKLRFERVLPRTGIRPTPKSGLEPDGKGVTMTRARAADARVRLRSFGPSSNQETSLMGVRCNKQVALTPLEIKGLWLLADHGTKNPPEELSRDPDLNAAGERALDKVWREHMGMGKHGWRWFWPFGRRGVQTSAKVS